MTSLTNEKKQRLEVNDVDTIPSLHARAITCQGHVTGPHLIQSIVNYMGSGNGNWKLGGKERKSA